MTELVHLWGVAENGDSIEVAVLPHLLTELLERWPPIGLTRHDSPTGKVQLSRGLSDEWVIIPDHGGSGDDPTEAAWDQLEQTMTAFTVQRLSYLVPVHAATIAWKGEVLVVPGPSGAGKSTLSVEAADLGATVLSDEYVLIDPTTALATGWRRPIYIAGDDGTTIRHDVAVDSDPLPVGLIAVIEYHCGARNAWSPITPGEAVGELLTHCVTAGLRASESMDAALAVTRSAPAIKGTRGDATEAIRELLGLME